MSQQNYNNLRLQVAGFFQCARHVFEIDANEDIKFIHFLHSNASSLELHFSKVRAQGVDTPNTCIVGVENNECRKASVSLSMCNNIMCANVVDEDEDQICFLDLMTKHVVLKRTNSHC